MRYRCSVKGCRSPGCFHCSVVLKDETKLNLFYCDSDEHFMDVGFVFRNKATTCETVEEVKKIEGFRLQTDKKTKTTTKTVIKPSKQKANNNWKWIEDSDYWMNTKGKRVRISTLDDKEVEDAVVAIRKANIKKVTKRIAWIKGLEEVCSSTVLFEYPEERLKVDDIEDAYLKLEEFYEVLTERKMLP